MQQRSIRQDAVIKEVVDVQLPIMKRQDEFARRQEGRYEQYQPLRDKYITELDTWGSEARKEEEAAKAQAEVAQSYEAERRNSEQRLQSYGLSPERIARGIDLPARIAKANATAQASNTARRDIDTRALGYRGEAYNLSSGALSQNVALTGQALAAGTGATQTNTSGNQAAGMMGTPIDWSNQSGNFTGNQVNAMGSQYNADIGRYNAKQANSPLNLIAKGAGAYFGAKFAEGGEVTSALPMPEGEISGPGGPRSDAIPAQLSDGEYVIPESTVRYVGLKTLDGMVAKSKEAMDERAQRVQGGPGSMAIPPPMAPAPA